MFKRTELLSSVVFVVLAVLLPMPGLAQEAPAVHTAKVDITGVWDLVVVTQQGDMPSQATFTQEKEALKVAMTGPEGTPVAGTGTVKEAAVEWTITFDTPNGSFSVVFAGKVDGEKMAGDMFMGEFGSTTWSAKKRPQK